MSEAKDNNDGSPPILDQRPIKERLKEFSGRDIEDRKVWYVPVAEAYDKARPKYPQSICDRILELAKLGSEGGKRPKLLEIGCGPGTATVNFAPVADIVCLEPNPAFCELARQNCASYPNVEIRNLALEEWDPVQEGEEGSFDLVYSANAFHWIPPEVGYPKVAQALKAGSVGHLVLLWNLNLEPSREIWEEHLLPVFQQVTPKLANRYEGPERQREILDELGQSMVDSGFFDTPVIESMSCERDYSYDEYLTLQSTYSPIVALSEEQRSKLFAGLKEAMEQLPKNRARDNDNLQLKLYNLCGFQLAAKKEKQAKGS